MSCLPDVAETALADFFELDEVSSIAGNLLYLFERNSALVELVIFVCGYLGNLMANFTRRYILVWLGDVS